MKRPVPTLNLFCGSTTGGLELLRSFLQALERFGEVPILNLGIDTDLGKIAKIEAEVKTWFPQRKVRFLALGAGVDLRAMVENASLHPEVSNTLSGIEKGLLPRTIDRGSQKVFAFTLAAFQASWAAPNGVLYTLQDAVKQLQEWRAEFGGRGKYIVNCTGLMCGGVGGIAPLLFAEAIRTIGEQNPEFGQNLEVNLIWVEPWPEETDPRILGNAREALNLLAAADQGRLWISVPCAIGINRLGGKAPLFDHTFIASEITSGGRLETQEFINGLAELLLVWSLDPLGDEAKGRLEDKLSIKEEVGEDGHRRFLQSFGIKGLSLEPNLAYAKAVCIQGLEPVFRQSSLTQEELQKEVENFIASDGLSPLEMDGALSSDRFGRPHMRREDLQEAIGQGLETRVVEGAPLEPWLREEVIPKALADVRRALDARAEEKKVETISSLEKILRPRLEGMEINDAVAFLCSLSQRFRAFKEEVHSWLTQPADELLPRALMRLERARMSSWLGRASRCRRAIRTLIEATTDHILQKERELRHKCLLQLYTDLEERVKTKENELIHFKQAFTRAIAWAKEILSGPPPYKTTGRLAVIEPLLEKDEYYKLLQEFLGCDPEKPGRDLVVALAKELQPFDHWGNDPERLYEKLGGFFGERLKEFGELGIPEYVRLKAKADHRGEEEVWAKILEKLGTGGAWWTVDHAKLPSQKPISSLTILATPTGDPPVSPDRVDVRVLGDPQRLVVLNVELGAHKQALRAWRWLCMVPEPADGKGPIRPPSLNPDHS